MPDITALEIERQSADDLRSRLASLPDADDAIVQQLIATATRRLAAICDALDGRIEVARSAERQYLREQGRSAARAA